MANLELTCTVGSKAEGQELRGTQGEPIVVHLFLRSLGVPHNGVGGMVALSWRVGGQCPQRVRVLGESDGDYLITIPASAFRYQSGVFAYDLWWIPAIGDGAALTDEGNLVVESAVGPFGEDIGVVESALPAVQQTIEIAGVLDLGGNVLPSPVVPPVRAAHGGEVVLRVTVAQLQGAGVSATAAGHAYLATAAGVPIGNPIALTQLVTSGVFEGAIGAAHLVLIAATAVVTYSCWVSPATGVREYSSHEPSTIAFFASGRPANIAPVINLAAIPASVSRNATIVLSGTASDPDGTLTAASFGATRGGVAVAAAFALADGAWSASVSSGATTGTIAFAVTVTDAIGATATATRSTVVLANESPVIAMAALAADVPPGALAISGTASDPDGTLTAASFGVTVGGVAQTLIFTYGSGAWFASVTVSSPGATAIVVTVTDSEGATATATRSTNVLTLPVVTVAAIPEQDETTVPVTVTIAPAPAAPVSVAIRVDGAANATVTVGTNGTGTGATTALAAGTHPVVARYAWAAGGTDIDSAAVNAVIVDQLPTLAITSHTAGQHVEVGALPVYGTVTHASATPVQLTVEFDLDDAFTSATAATYNPTLARWEASLTVATEAAHTIRMRAHDATAPAEWVVATPVSVSSVPLYVRVTTTAAATTFTPLVILAVGSTATVRWVCEETAQELTGLSPTFTWGSAATRHVRMYVETTGAVDARADVRTFNLGFIATNDAGRYNLGYGFEHTAQPIVLVEYIAGLTGLVNFCAANTELAGTLDFTGLTNLQHIEIFSANVTGITLPAASDFRRLCAESNNLTNLDLNPVASTIYDLRAALQQGFALSFTALTAPLARLYHLCIRDQVVTGMPTDAQLPVVEELWCWNTGQTRALAPISTVITSINANDNPWSSVTLPPTATALDDILLEDCTLSTSEVDAVLLAANAYATSNGVLNLAANSGPSPTGEAAAVALVARGWTVGREAQVGEGVLSDNFNRADGAVGNGWHTPAGFAATGVIASNMLQRTDTAGYQVYVNPAGGGLPADYTVTATFPHSTAQTTYYGLVGRWNGTDGVRVLVVAAPPYDYTQIWCGNAATYNGGNVVLTEDNPVPASWSQNQTHTLTLRMTGTLIEILLDGVLVGHRTLATNATATGTEYGICGEGGNRLWDSIGTST